MIFQVFNLVCQSIESNYSKLINALPLKFFFSMVYKEIRNILYVNNLLVWWNGHLELSLRYVRKASGAIITMCFNKVLSREKKQVNRNLNNSKNDNDWQKVREQRLWPPQYSYIANHDSFNQCLWRCSSNFVLAFKELTDHWHIKLLQRY